MVKVQAIMDFTYKNYDKIRNLNSYDKIEEGKIFENDIFEVEPAEALYLVGNNDIGIIAVKVLEIIPNKIVKDKNAEKIEIKAIKKINKRYTDKEVRQ